MSGQESTTKTASISQSAGDDCCNAQIGGFNIRSYDGDYIWITGKYPNKSCKICIGDFESILSGLCSVEKAL